MQPVLWAAAGTGFTCLMTVLGASMVFFFRKRVTEGAQRIFLGFAAGVMVAASVWSLLIPAIEEAESQGVPGWLPAAGGFLLGVGFLMALDSVMPHLHLGADQPEGHLLLEAHHPAGSRGDAAQHPRGHGRGLFLCPGGPARGRPRPVHGALALALGMGLQNFPEGAAISLPLRQEGCPPGRALPTGAFRHCRALFGILGGAGGREIQPLLPWLLAFAAGAMLYVVVEELIPEAHLGEHSNIGTLGVMAGFLVMMVLDVALG